MPESPVLPPKDRTIVQRRPGTPYLRLVAILAVTGVAFGFAISTIDLGLVWHVAKQISVETIAIVGALLLLGALLAAIRFWFMASDLGHGLSPRDALLALSVGQIVGTLTVQYFGQIAARSALLGPRGLSPPANIVLATYERFIAAAVSAALAVTGAWYLFGRVALNLQAGGDQFVKLILGIAVATVAGGVFGWGPTVIDAVQRQPRIKIVVSIVRSICLTLAIQICTIAAYVVGAHSLAPNISIMEVSAAAMVVTFVASLPISFAGWGVRELSAVLALGAIGVQNETALTVAIFIGTVAMAVVIVVAIVATILPHGRAPIESAPTASSEYAEIVSAVQFGIPLLAATAVFFQVFVPINTTLVNINLADPVAILGGSLFVLYSFSGVSPRWRLSWLNGHVAVATGVLVLAFLHGLYSFGWNDWAFTNKLLGWLILLGYGATGALLVNVSSQGMILLARTFVAVAVGIVVLEVLLLIARIVGMSLPKNFVALPIEGFSQNRNAFALILLLAVCVSTLIKDRTQGWILGVLFAGLWFAGSRASFGALLAVLLVALFLRALSIRNIIWGVAAGAAIVALIAALPFAVAASSGGSGGASFDVMVFQMVPVSSDLERFKSITDGLSLFLAHPLFGNGLGAYASDTLVPGKFVVIHSTPIWLLAETGMIGFLAFAIPAARVFWNEWTLGRRDDVGRMLLLILVTYGVMSLVHELLYQRALWLLLGAALACVVPPMKAEARV